MPRECVEGDPRILRAVAHPMRGSLLYELQARDAATATMLAEAVNAPVNAVSFHLHTLAKYGLIEEAPELARDGRERWWRRTSEKGLAFHSDEVADMPGGPAALDVFRAHSVAAWHGWVDRFFDDSADEPGVVRAINDVPMLLSDAEASEFHDELLALLFRYNKRGQDATTESRRTYLALTLLLPLLEASSAESPMSAVRPAESGG
ncbi:MAG TPA: helix-turn-helix domain-containing protein [Nocardioidaceae bacterium]|nr:helix-turn-helix domain-containing protein [Nocardioidaceae bacterium]